MEALRALADRLPEEVAATGDLVEIRPDVDPEARSYLGEEARDREEALEDMGAGDGEEARASDEDQAGTEDQDKGDPSHG
ncbi:MAG: hypothetical protein EA352_11380 [Gemmatimonadales bacterium]|nr:MAG: hypothetical protein EA352_11380 [Gemmatimonadales bacterium]